MEVYLLKSTACLIVLFSFYKLFLEKENMHIFKRFYLLGIVVASFGIPLLTFPSYTDSSEIVPLELMPNVSGITSSESNFLLDHLSTIIWSIYTIGVLFFSIRFGKNLLGILLKIKQNQKLKLKSFVNVLLFDAVIPHTFFNFIFLNKQKYEAREIPEEVLVHEQTHAQQKHSIDIVFMELLQIVFWFNPILYFIKYSVKLNHEFLADQAVLKKGIDSSFYQNLLLTFSSKAATPLLANSINYSFIKKRFTVMKTQTSKRRIWIKSIILMPLLAVLIFGFSSREEIEKETNPLKKISVQKGATKEQIKEYNTLAKKYNNMPSKTMRIKKNDIERLKYLYDLMSSKQRKNAEPFPNFPPPPPPPSDAPSYERAPKAVKGVKSDIPPPPPPVSSEKKEKELKKVKELKKANKKKEDNLVLRTKEIESRKIDLEHRNEDLNRKKEELKLERVAVLEKKEEERYQLRKLKQEEVSLVRIEERNALRLKRVEERKSLQNERLKEHEKRNLKLKERQLELEKKKKEEFKKQKIKKGTA